jgi:4-aminobutyrate aminotransferase-like enzyme
MKRLRLWERAATLGAHIQKRLPARGKGLMLGLEVGDAATLCERLLQRGVVAIPEGERSEVLGITPPLAITHRELDFVIRAICELLP